MAGETTITVIGNLTADPEVRYTQGGKAVANGTIASTPRFFDRQTNDWKDGETLFLRYVAWRNAEGIGGNLRKGRRVIAVGVLKQKSYDDREGKKVTYVELEVDSIGAVIIDPPANGGQRPPAQQPKQEPAWTADAPVEEPWAAGGSYNDETPF